ncbi:MFS transporter [Falsiporphyromonas endometrii]|uniref:Lysosomal dipeptide transporter MFSD1 n=1 Tax=Falsiporphyromonas endometrii TaxID=1387297 RepID=A0ABV9K7N7_9PORP
MTQTTVQSLRDKPAVRWTALILVALTMFFGYMFVDVLSPLKTQLEETVKWDSTIFGTYGSSEFFINVFCGFLIFAGIILDKMGVRFTAILSGSLMLLGAIIKIYALSEYFNMGGIGFDLLNSASFPASAKLSCIGFALFGCGCEMGGVTVSRAIVKWFQGKEMALAMGIEMAIARLGVFAVFWTSPMISKHFAQKGEMFLSVQAPVIFVGILLAVGLILYIIYGFMDKALEKEQGAEEIEEEEPFKFSDLGKVFGSGMFWIVALLCVLYYSAIFPFQKYATEMLSSNIGLETETAAKIFSMFPLGAMFITPLLGAFLDYKGKGATMLIIGAVLMFACHATFAFFPFNEVSHMAAVTIAITAIVVLGISFSLVPAALWPSVPKIIDNKVLGSAYSAIFFIQNIGLMSVPIIIGRILDVTNPNVAPGEPKNYTTAMIVFAMFGVAAFFLGFVLKIADKKKGFGLELPNKTK